MADTDFRGDMTGVFKLALRERFAQCGNGRRLIPYGTLSQRGDGTRVDPAAQCDHDTLHLAHLRKDRIDLRLQFRRELGCGHRLLRVWVNGKSDVSILVGTDPIREIPQRLCIWKRRE